MSLLVSLLKESNYNDAKNLLMRHPEVVHDTDSETGNHCIFYSLGSPELTNLILEMKPDAIKLKTSIGNNPLHVAAQTNAPIETLKVLISHKKSCASVKNSDGKVPLHYAAALGEYATIEVIDILIDAYPSGPAIKEMKNNSCPLHYACAFRASENVINALQDALVAIGEHILGITKEEVGTHSMRSGAAMKMYLGECAVLTIMLIGCWLSNAFLCYIRKQVMEFSQNVAKKMLTCQNFCHIPDIHRRIPQDDPRQQNNPNNSETQRNVGGNMLCQACLPAFSLYS
jgi:ankyrin repeat protein